MRLSGGKPRERGNPWETILLRMLREGGWSVEVLFGVVGRSKGCEE